MARKRKKKTFNPWKRRISGGLLAIIACVALGFGNWFAHLPRAERATFGSWESTLEALGAVTADLTDALGVTGQDVEIPYTQKVAKGPLPFGIPVAEDLGRAPNDILLLKRQGYWVGYSPSQGHPVWAAYAVPTQKLLEAAPKRPPFQQDPQVPNSTHPDHYTHSGYDRGHFAPNYAIATRYNRAAQIETFLMTNIAPQKPKLNQGPWRDLEHLIATDLSGIGDTIWVIVCSIPDQEKQYLRSKQGKTKVRIPKGFGMVIASIHEGKLRALGVYMPQTLTSSKKPRYCFYPVRELEAMTGLNFFSALTYDQQKALELPEANRFWPTWELF